MSDTVLSRSQEQEISWKKLIMAQSVTAHVPHRQPGSHTDLAETYTVAARHVNARKSRHTTHTRVSLLCVVKCLHYKVRGSHVFAGTRGPVTHCRYIHMAVLFHPVCVCVCPYACACGCVPLFVCASVWIGVYLSSVNQTGVYPDSQITGLGFLPVPFPITAWISHCGSADHFADWQLCVGACWISVAAYLILKQSRKQIK